MTQEDAIFTRELHREQKLETMQKTKLELSQQQQKHATLTNRTRSFFFEGEGGEQ